MRTRSSSSSGRDAPSAESRRRNASTTSRAPQPAPSSLERPLPPQATSRYEQQAAESLREQREIEAADDLPFEQFRQRYLAQDLMGGEHFRPLRATADGGR